MDSDNNSENEDTHHLMRVRIHKRNFARLKSIAKHESQIQGEFISVSDLVRTSIHNLMQVHETKERLEVVLNPSHKMVIRKG